MDRIALFKSLLEDCERRITEPVGFNNENFATDFYDFVKQLYNESSLHICGDSQYVCFNNESRKNLINQLKKEKESYKEIILEYNEFIDEVKRGII